MIFESKERVDMGDKHPLESEFAFFDRSARPEMEKVRSFLTRCLDDFPENDRPELIKRITGSDKNLYNSAVFELLLYTVFKYTGCNIEVHPALENGHLTRPDFLITTPTGERVYVEAVKVSELTKEEIVSDKLIAELLYRFKGTVHPDFVVIFDAIGIVSKSQPSKKIVNQVVNWLNGISSGEIQGKESEQLIISHEGGYFALKPIRKSPGSDWTNTGLVAVSAGDGSRLDTHSRIKYALKKKAVHYGQLPHPIMIAINVEGFTLTHHDIFQSLFGDLVDTVELKPPYRVLKSERKPNGFWWSKPGYRFREVGGVWFFANLSIGNAGDCKNTVCFNPMPLFPLPEFFKIFDHAIPGPKEMELKQGRKIGEILGLNRNWPRADFHWA